MLAKAFDDVLGGLVIDANGENRVDDAEGEAVVAVFLRLKEIG